MAIVVFLTALAAPSFIGMLTRSRLREGARTILAQCKFAREVATREETYARVEFDAEEGISQVRVLVDVTDQGESERSQSLRLPGSRLRPEQEWEWQQPGATLGKPRRLPDGIDFDRMASRNEDMSQQITFAPDGRADDFFLTLKDERGGKLAVHVNGTTGGVDIIAPDDRETLAKLEQEFSL